MKFLAIDAAVPLERPAWGRVRFKSAFDSLELRAGNEEVVRLSLSSMGHLYPREGAADRQQASEATMARSLLVEPGQLVINPMWLAGGSIATSRVAGSVSPDYRVFQPKPVIAPRFAHFLLRSRPYMDQYALFVRANTTFDRRVQQSDINSMPLLLPDYDEQRRIADFLDDRVSRIDRIIAARNEQAALLTLQEIAGIQEIFDSSAERFGLIRLGYLLSGLEQGWSPQAEAQPADEDEWGVMRSGCVNGGHFRAWDNKRLPAQLEPVTKYEIRGGDLLMSRASGSIDLIGSVAVVPKDVRKRLLLCDKLYRLAPAPAWSSDFLAPMLRAKGNRERIRLGVSGADGMANNLPSGVIRDLRVPAVPHAGQIEVTEQAHKLAQRTDSIRVAISRSIDLLSEYKTSLITAAVTGELDVTTAGSKIPG